MNKNAVHKGSELVDMVESETAIRVSLILAKIWELLPTLLTYDLLEAAEKFPEQFELSVKDMFLNKRDGLRARVAGFAAVDKAQEYIRAHFSESLKLGAVAKIAGLSTSYFCKLFKRNFSWVGIVAFFTCKLKSS